MAKQESINYNHLFMIIIFFIGVVLFSISWNIDEKLQDTTCTNKPLKTSNKLVLCIGTILIVFSCFKVKGILKHRCLITPFIWYK